MRKFLILSLSFLLFSSSVYAENIAIIDAGSTGSRLYFYQYETSGDSKWPDITQLSSKKVKPGLSSFAKDPEAAAHSIADLIDYDNLPDDEKHIPIYLMATAGMRLVSPLQQEAIYSAITTYLRNDTQFQVKQVGTMPGQWEGIYGWLALNYLNGTLQPGQTVGMLDMGGASTQVAYELPNGNETLSLNLGDVSLEVNSQSFLGMGQEHAREQYMNDKNCYPLSYPLPSGQLGTGNAPQCSIDTSALINGVHHVSVAQNSIPSSMQFIATSGYFYTASALGIADVMTPQQLSSAAFQFCHTPWPQLQDVHPDDSYLPMYCFSASYMSAVLTQGYQFSGTKSIRVLSKIDGADLDWALGAALYVKMSE